ncbi:hypothetical protein HK405_012038 [Cladochytrium tenue]|nr:hypothetical protein HK405_012038 [Cladochytrium tenue]
MAASHASPAPPVAAPADAPVTSQPFITASGTKSDKELAIENNELIVGDQGTSNGFNSHVPLYVKIAAVLMVSAIGFGSHWSNVVTSAIKSTLKTQLGINNAQYAALDASDDFIMTVLILFSGLWADRIGGSGALLYGNMVYTAGSVLVAAAATVRSYNFMIGAFVVRSIGFAHTTLIIGPNPLRRVANHRDSMIQTAQYKVFCNWFAPSNGFASTLGLELGLGKIGSFVGQSTANIIATRTGNFAWVYWTAVFINLFTNIVSLVYFRFSGWSEKHFGDAVDPATGERLVERARDFRLRRVFELPWPYWCLILFSLFQTSCAAVFISNATELAQQRFSISAVTAGWYSATAQYFGFFLVPLLGMFIDFFGNRLTVAAICGAGMLLAMSLAQWGPTVAGTASAFAVYAFASSLGPTVIIDGIRSTVWSQESFGTAYAVKVAVTNAMNILVRIVAGVVQDADGDRYDRVVAIYVFLAAGAALVGLVLLAAAHVSPLLGRLQWSRRRRIADGATIVEMEATFKEGTSGRRNKQMSTAFFVCVLVLVFGSWIAYFWGVATGHNE